MKDLITCIKDYSSVLKVLDENETINNMYFVRERDHFRKMLKRLAIELNC